MKKRSEECPKCRESTVRHNPRFNGKRCSNSQCNWTESQLTAADVSKSFLEFCLESSKHKSQKDRIKKIIMDTFGSL